ncbi:MAG: phosphoglycerate kinase [archaeon]|nr:phosphoglycerate kinase [archaeon]
MQLNNKRRFSIHNYPLEDKVIFLRTDYNLEIAEKSKQKEEINLKIKESLPTINFLLDKNCKIIIATHLGRPNGKIVPELSVQPLIKELKQQINREDVKTIQKIDLNEPVIEKIHNAKKTKIFFLENLRFDSGEEKNSPIFAKKLSSLADIYVNDAFGASHRKHASIDAITQFLPSMPGFLIEKEINQLNKALKPKHPLAWILGGAKLDKIELINQALQKADYVLVGGALAFPFLKAKGIPIGMSKVDQNSINLAKEILNHKNSAKIILPVDFIASEEFSVKAKGFVVPFNHILPKQICLDLGPQTINLFKQYLRKTHTIVWNGPLGYFEWTQFATATREIARYISNLTATTICGGGETSKALQKYHLADKMTHVSTGGGASIAFLSGKNLPGLDAFYSNYKKFGKIKKRLKHFY